MKTDVKRVFRNWNMEPLYKVQYGSNYDTPFYYYTDTFAAAVKTARFALEVLRNDYANVLKRDVLPGRYISVREFRKGC